MTSDDKFFNDAFLAFAYRTKIDKKFTDLTIEQQSKILMDAQILKSASIIRNEAIQFEASQPMPGDKF